MPVLPPLHRRCGRSLQRSTFLVPRPGRLVGPLAGSAPALVNSSSGVAAVASLLSDYGRVAAIVLTIGPFAKSSIANHHSMHRCAAVVFTTGRRQ